MGQLQRKGTALSLAMLLSVFSFGLHVSAMSQSPVHTGNGMGHATNTSSCGSVCALATSYKNELIEIDEDDEPQAPFYLQAQSQLISGLVKKHEQETKAAIEREPPPGGLPAYISLTVFRA